MPKELDKHVAYMEDHDFDKNGKLINNDAPKDIPVVIMIQATWCGHCKKAIPAFQEFANSTVGKVFCATIQIDGERPSEVALGKRIKKIDSSFRGFPHYFIILGGKTIPKEIKGRSVKHLRKFATI